MELTFTPKFVSGKKGNVPEPPHALPVFDMRPMELNVAQPAVPPALETMRFVVLAVPETERLELVALVKFANVLKRFVLVALVEVDVSVLRLKMVEDALERSPEPKVCSAVNTFAVYVFGIVVEE